MLGGEGSRRRALVPRLGRVEASKRGTEDEMGATGREEVPAPATLIVGRAAANL